MWLWHFLALLAGLLAYLLWKAHLGNCPVHVALERTIGTQNEYGPSPIFGATRSTIVAQ